MRVPHREDVANRSDPESCAAGREARGEALTGADAGQVLSCEITQSGAPTLLSEAEGHIGEAPQGTSATTVNGDGTRLPFADDTFDRIICSEVMEHIPDDAAAASELARVLKPGGTIAVTVPTWLPEQVCWALSDEYHAPFVEGGHVRIFTEASLRRRFRDAGLKPGDVHHAHALHSPYWWLKCAVGPTNDTNPLVQAYHRLLVWDITEAPKLTRWTEKLLNPVLGKSLVLYSTKPEV